MSDSGKLCVTIKPDSARRLDVELAGALRKRPDLIELRLDGMQVREIPKVADKIGRVGSRTILTLRSKGDGGGYGGDDSERREIIESLLPEKFRFLDIELGFAKRNIGFVRGLKDAKIPMIVSYHNFYTTPSSRVLRQIFAEMNGIGDVAKIVTMANEPLDNMRVFGLYSNNPGKGNLLAFAMGDFGRMSRILSVTCYGAPFAYCSVGEPVAPGMMGIDEMRKILRAVPRQQQSEP